MTAIVGMTNGRQWAIACDSGAYNDAQGTFARPRQPKVWQHDNALFGCSGGSNVRQLVNTCESSEPERIAEHLSGAKGSWRLLIVRQEGVWELDDDGSLYQWDEDFGAIGAGEAYCRGVISEMLYLKNPSPFKVVTHALDLAVKSVTDARPPVQYLVKRTTLRNAATDG
jgi:hypothetical protein